MPRKKTIADDNLLNAARSIFSERGFAAPTRDIARLANVSEGLLFQRYRTKDELFFAAMVPPAISLAGPLSASGGAGFEESFRAAARAMLDYFRAAAPIFAQLSTHPGFRFEEFAARHPQSALVALRGELIRFFAQHRAPDPSGAALLLISSLHGIAMFEHLGAYGGRLPAEFVGRAIQCAWMAVRPPA
ncbi:MAG: TetR/AcrR family transcriptional regulator [Bryobacterales bacterium]|nr:TetR/AcrR family transcriptional regulator [Bryobacterales bacterium]